MANPPTQSPPLIAEFNSQPSLEARLRPLLARQTQLLLEIGLARDELERVNAEVMQIYHEYSTSPARDDEYCQCVKKITGTDPRDDLKAIEEARNNPNPITMEQLIAELEQTTDR